jgi:proteasome lid subunit RPN8/RPN11
MIDLEAVTCFRVSKRILDETSVILRQAGTEEVEAWVLWVGRSEGTEFQVVDYRVPRQNATMVSTTVDQDAIIELFDELRDTGLHLGIQVHSHPGAAFHSATDNEHPIATQYGSLSIVVPNFCESGMSNLDGCAVFRLGRMAWCGPLPRRVLDGLIEVVE